MRLFGWLGNRRRTNDNVTKNKSDATATGALVRLTADLQRLSGRLNTVDIALKRHDDRLARHEVRLQEHAQMFQTLEQKIAISPASPRTFRAAGRQREAVGSRVSSDAARPKPAQQFDIEQFTEQQKRLLAVFFQNKGRRMSYADLAAVMNKSACTIKNQVNQIRRTADLFDCSIGSQSRNLFKLKDDLRVEQYLKVSQPAERSRAVEEADSSTAEATEPVVEYAYVRADPEKEGDRHHDDQPAENA